MFYHDCARFAILNDVCKLNYNRAGRSAREIPHTSTVIERGREWERETETDTDTGVHLCVDIALHAATSMHASTVNQAIQMNSMPNIA